MVLFRKVYAPICSIKRVLSALRGALLTKKVDFQLIIVAIHSEFNRPNAFVKIATDERYVSKA